MRWSLAAINSSHPVDAPIEVRSFILNDGNLARHSE
jgi:hypothetical protein